MIPIAEQIACARRELAMRRNVYPKRVAALKMSQAKADHEIDAMTAVIETLRQVEAFAFPAEDRAGPQSEQAA